MSVIPKILRWRFRLQIRCSTGFVGATAGYALLMRRIGRELVLVDKNSVRAAAEADDLRHAVPFR
jgi:malate/lactate dehydrogenase